MLLRRFEVSHGASALCFGMKRRYLLLLGLGGGPWEPGYVHLNLQPNLRTSLYASRPRHSSFVENCYSALKSGLVSRHRRLSDLGTTPIESHEALASSCTAASLTLFASNQIHLAFDSIMIRRRSIRRVQIALSLLNGEIRAADDPASRVDNYQRSTIQPPHHRKRPQRHRPLVPPSVALETISSSVSVSE